MFVLWDLCFCFHFCVCVVGFVFLFSLLCLCCGICVSVLFLSATVWLSTQTKTLPGQTKIHQVHPEVFTREANDFLNLTIVYVCNVVSRLRGQTYTCPLYIAFCSSGLGHQHTRGTDGSRYQSIYETTEPSQPMMSDDVSNEDRPQHRELRPLLFSNSVGSLTSHRVICEQGL